jgi:hypothetical protein
METRISLFKNTFCAGFLLLACSCFGQLSSIESFGEYTGVYNPNLKWNASHTFAVRFNQKIGWTWSGNIAIGWNTTNFNIEPQTPNFLTDVSNKCNALQIGFNYQILTALRTLKAGWSDSKWSNSIALKGFKWYLCGGIEFLQMKQTTDKLSFTQVTNVFEGTGFEIYRLGKGARRRFPAFVPFSEFRYYQNTSGGYYPSEKGAVIFNKMSVLLGLKYTFGLPGQ